LAEHAEGIGGAFEFRLRPCLAFGAGIGAHFPGRPMPGQRILLVSRRPVGIHAGKEIIGLVVFAHMAETEVPVLLVIGAALWRAMRTLVCAARPFAGRDLLARARLLRARFVGLDANTVEKFR